MPNPQRRIFLSAALALGSAFSAVQLMGALLTHSISNPLVPSVGLIIELASQPVRFWLMTLSFAVLTLALGVGAYRVFGQERAA